MNHGFYTILLRRSIDLVEIWENLYKVIIDFEYEI